MTVSLGPAEVPAAFATAVESLRSASTRAEVSLSEAAPPRRIAPYAHALTGEVHDGDGELASGRLVLLHHPGGHEGWDGESRIVTYVRTDIDEAMSVDPLLPEVGWSWLIEALTTHGARYAAAGGTVTRTSSARFGDMASEPDNAEVELRASWSPLEDDLAAHLSAWCDLLCSVAGLPPSGVLALSPRPPAARDV